jgi:hypothetical protein
MEYKAKNRSTFWDPHKPLNAKTAPCRTFEFSTWWYVKKPLQFERLKGLETLNKREFMQSSNSRIDSYLSYFSIVEISKQICWPVSIWPGGQEFVWDVSY